jgi:hypothetical protein
MSARPLPAWLVHFDRLRDREDLARAIGIGSRRLSSLIESPRAHYWPFEIPKRDARRGSRLVWSCPDRYLSLVLRGLDSRLRAYLYHRFGLPHDIVHGYVPERSSLTNARVHLGAPAFLKADIKSFFPSIGAERVSQALASVGITRPVAADLASLSCPDGSLALGLPHSPTLANLACRHLDEELADNCDAQCKVTRYADDITWSGPRERLPEISAVEAERVNAFETAGMRNLCREGRDGGVA